MGISEKLSYTYITKEGNINIYSDPLVYKPKTQIGALETPVHEDARGRIERKNLNGLKFNIIETKKGFMRSGDLHKSTQLDLVLSGKIELWILSNNITEKSIIGPNEYIVIKPHTPHLFSFLENTIMIEWWDGPFEAWFYKPYRDIIDQQFKA